MVKDISTIVGESIINNGAHSTYKYEPQECQQKILTTLSWNSVRVQLLLHIEIK